MLDDSEFLLIHPDASCAGAYHRHYARKHQLQHSVAGVLVDEETVGFDWAAAAQRPGVAVLFGGGADIHPFLYGQKNTASQCNIARDLWEVYVYNQCVHYGIPMLGICRGHQFLAAMHGGKLIQDIGTEFGRAAQRIKHGIVLHNASPDFVEMWRDSPMGDLQVNSYHHQAVDANTLPTTATVLATDSEHPRIVEAALWRQHDYVSAFSVQSHPEDFAWFDPFAWFLRTYHSRD